MIRFLLIYSKNQTRAKQMSIGRKKFNMDPKKGIEWLIQQNLLEATEISVAQFLYKGEGLNKTAIGDYLGERHDFNEKVLKNIRNPISYIFIIYIFIIYIFIIYIFIMKGFCK